MLSSRMAQQVLPNHGLLIFQDFHENEGGGGGGGGKSDWQYVLESIDRLNRLVMANESSFAPFSLRGEIEDLASKSGLPTNANFVFCFIHGLLSLVTIPQKEK